ncbi:hypothetical protein Gbro_3137 [Gordonia bronchialis DSM 43247]|uniref:Uncharacterized protein n=1 Tax=Gordonia bronchialis (strain ATCC 25592 / DSM 43247 / BCRC 13721 / JCM 3198 / KCTC 3076 / NBRC 16047 / NCTC 10667) TaxID=526226 RepID=D0LBV6_GORB4|nr:hypothetical protein Gbro_3137 [Gordonia bronchialis DSM 43247]STQ65269.1 Uncharacterised protein [Gordonia bronchialis]
MHGTLVIFTATMAMALCGVGTIAHATRWPPHVAVQPLRGPKGTTSTECYLYQVTQHDIVPGDTFGVSVKSYSGASVSCTIRDIESGDLVYSDSAGPYATANCLRHATGEQDQAAIRLAELTAEALGRPHAGHNHLAKAKNRL